MVAFRTSRDRLLYWIKALDMIYYYEWLGKNDSYVIEWNENPPVITSHEYLKSGPRSTWPHWVDWAVKPQKKQTNLKSGIIGVSSPEGSHRNSDNSQHYKLTFHVQTGLIQAQGNKYYDCIISQNLCE